jgi:gliding motility-associated protein GldM
MAGGKESPRQKMINMMYLVLTAMLALQVSSAILEKFQLINTSLEKFNGSIHVQNDKTIEAMKKAIEKSDKPENGVYLTKAGQVRKESADLVSYIEDLKNEIIEKAGGGLDPETGTIKNLAEDEKVTNLMVGPNKNGKGYDLKKKLDDYVAKLQGYGDPKSKLKGLALSGAEDPMLSKKAGVSILGKDFSELNFGQTPVPAALAMLSQKQTEVRGSEGEVLDYLATLVNAKEYLKFDQMFAVVSAESKTVVAGQKYKAEVAIGAYSSAISPRISVNGSAVPVKDGRGQIEFIAQGGDFKDGMLKKTYTANITFPKPDGSMQTVNREETYTVLQPTVQIESGTLPPLYFKCGNKLQVTSPGLGQLFRPTFSGSGADFLAGEGGKVTVVPNASRVVLNVNNDGNLLKSFPFKVQLVPKPDLVLYVNGSPLGSDGERKGVAASSVRSIEMKAVADQSFKTTNPDDANFRVTSVTIILASGTRPKGGKIESSNGGANVSNLASVAAAGDRYVISVRGVQRRNFKGEVLDVEIGEQNRTINLN